MHMELVCKQQNNKNIVDIYIFFHYIWCTDSENLFHSYLERKNDKVLVFNIVHFPNFEISASSN